LPSGTVSFLFSDVVGSTALLTTLDQARYARLLEAQRDCIEQAVAAAGGAIVDRAGDGMLAAFASAKAALSAAVAGQRSLAGVPEGELVAVRMGIDSGDVLLRERSYVGPAVHRGTRICALASGGCVLLSATSRALVGGEVPEGVELREVGAVTLAGFPEQTQLFQAVLADIPASAVRPRLSRGLSVDLLERDTELEILDEHVRSAARGSGGVLAIEGPAGIGKTALLQARLGAATNMRRLDARATELETGYPFGVVHHLLEQAVREAPDIALAAAAAAAAPIFGHGREASVGDGFAVLHALYWVTVNLAEQQPLLLAIDDIQWCDAPSLRYLAYLAPRLNGLPIALLVTRRSGEAAADEEALQAVLADAGTNRVVPRELGHEAVTELLRRRLGEEPSSGFVRACRDATGSNPLLLRELVTALTAAGVAPTDAAVPAIPQVGPVAVSRFVLRRLARLSDTARAVSESVAVLGDGCSLAAAAEHAGLDYATAADAAGSLALAELLAPGPSLRFVHPLVREAVYLQLAPAERARSHARAAALVADGDPIRIGLHLLHAPPGAAEPAALRAAAEAAGRDGAPETAAAFLERLLAEPLEPEERTATLSALGASELLFDPARAAAHLAEAARDGEDDVGYTALQLARALYVVGRYEDAVAVLQQALEGMAPETDLAYRLQAELVGPLSELRDDRAVRDLLEGVHGRPLRGDGIGRRMLSAQIASTLVLPLPREEYVRLAREAVQDELLLEDETSDIYVWATVGLSTGEEWAAAGAALDRAIAHGRERGSLHLLTTALRFRAWLNQQLGELASAEIDARAALAALELRPLPVSVRQVTATLVDVLVDRGELEEASMLLETLPRAPDVAEPNVVIYARARLALATGDAARALAFVTELDDDTARGPAIRAVGPRPWRLVMAEALALLNRTDDAQAVADTELRRAGAWGAPTLLGRSLRTAALSAPTNAQLQLLKEADDVLGDSPARLERARVRAALGAATRRAGARAAARDLLRQALELAHLCGATRLEREIHDELVIAGARPRRTRLSGVESLTPSELRVARLAAANKPNREIAQELFVTLKTVEMHLASSYRKLGISSRSQLPGILAAQEQG
jgi:class 3 adenylate cyclase/DNA-binding CsgD family transcriptional regulator